jgi:hypothetical protein
LYDVEVVAVGGVAKRRFAITAGVAIRRDALEDQRLYIVEAAIIGGLGQRDFIQIFTRDIIGGAIGVGVARGCGRVVGGRIVRAGNG